MITTVIDRQLNHLLREYCLQSRSYLRLCKRHRSERGWKDVQKDVNRHLQEIPIFQYAPETNLKVHDRIYVWGLGTTGALGLRNYCINNKEKPLECKTPRKLACFHFAKVIDVACGHGFSVFAAQVNDIPTQLFGTGINTDRQIGFHKDQQTGGTYEVLATPVPIKFPENMEKPDIAQVACGRAHTIILGKNNKLYSLGNNSFGQCGVAIAQKKSLVEFTRINVIKEIPGIIKKVVCGQDHSLFLTEDGQVYSCGWGADGQTGLGHFENTDIPTKVRGDIEGEKIVDVSSFADGALACNDKGDVFCWGNSEYAQFRLVTQEDQLSVPRRLPISVGKVVQVAAGGTMCGLLNEKGQVYVWGFGILGQGPKVDHLSKPSLLPEPLFGRTEISPDVKVTSLHAGLSRWAAINSKGDLFCWGKNRNGCLGFKDKGDRYFPLRVNMPIFIKKVSLGIDHTAVIGRTLI